MQEEINEILEGFSPGDIEDDSIRQIVFALINLVERLHQENKRLREENQELRDEIKRLKGSNPRPDVDGQEEQDRSSEEEREEELPEEPEPDAGEQASEKGKNESIKVDREEVIGMDEEELPEDAEFKGYEERVVQDIHIETDNVLYRREKYYSPSRGETYVADLPEGIQGKYGPEVTGFALTLANLGNVTDEKLKEILEYLGIQISKGGLVNLLTRGHERLHEEKEEIREAAKQVTPNQGFDHTGMKVNGENRYCGILSTRYSTVYQVTENKSRHDVIKAVCGIRDSTYRLGEATLCHLEKLSISSTMVDQLREIVCDRTFEEGEFEKYIRERISDVGPQQMRWIKEAGLYAWAIEEGKLNMERMVCDDAREFMCLLPRALCWIHEGRHYKELTPLAPQFQQIQEAFLGDFWDLYKRLRRFKRTPTPEEAEQIEERFDELFSTETGYEQLDRRIERTRQKKEELLRVLEDPTIPLHNNAAERGARRLVVKRNISQQTRSDRGTKCWETFLSILETCRKLGVNFMDYIEDRVSNSYQMSSLAELIRERSEQKPVDWSYSLSNI